MPNMTDEQKISLQQIVAYMWNDERRDFECNPDDEHIFTSLVRLREFLEQEGIEVFPEPDWHKAFVAASQAAPETMAIGGETDPR